MRALCLLVLLLLAPSVVAANDVDPDPPLFAAAIRYSDSTIVSWSPGAGVADSFNIYGVKNDMRSLLDSVVEQTFTEVASAFPTYEVTAVTDGVESAPVTALTIDTAMPCRIVIDLPTVYVGCSPKVSVAVYWELLPSGFSLVMLP